MPVTQQRITLLLRSLDAMRQMVPEATAGGGELQPQQIELTKQLASGEPEEAIGAQPTQPVVSPRRAGLRQGDASAWMERAGTIRVDTQKRDRMLNLAGEIAIAQGRLRQAIEQTGNEKTEALEAQEQVEHFPSNFRNTS